MKVIKSVTKGNKKIVTVECHPDEQLMGVRPNSMYRLGYPIEDIVPPHVIQDAIEAAWCPISQQWITS